MPYGLIIVQMFNIIMSSCLQTSHLGKQTQKTEIIFIQPVAHTGVTFRRLAVISKQSVAYTGVTFKQLDVTPNSQLPTQTTSIDETSTHTRCHHILKLPELQPDSQCPSDQLGDCPVCR